MQRARGLIVGPSNIKIQRAKQVCDPCIGQLPASDLGVDVAKPSVQGLLVDSQGFWVEWSKEVSHVSPH
jgi:hypothetical protein